MFCWIDNLDEYTAGHTKRVACYGKALTTLDPPAERVEFPLERITLPAYLRKPRGAGRPPVVLFISGLDSTKEEHATFERFFLQPMDGPQAAANTEWAIAQCLRDPRWRLSVQTHKVIGIR